MRFSIILIIFFVVALPGCTNKEKKFELIHHHENKTIDVLVNNEFFTTFHYHEEVEKPLLHPIKAKNDTFITRGWPLKPQAYEQTNHPHQKGQWFNYGNVNGYDFWNYSKARSDEDKHLYGRIILDSIHYINDGKDGRIGYAAYWITLPGDTLIKEEKHYIFSESQETRTIRQEIRLTAQQNVTFDDHYAGMLAIRLSEEFTDKNYKPDQLSNAQGIATPIDKIDTNIAHKKRNANGWHVTSEGIEGPEAWGSIAKWATVTAFLAKDTVSVGIIDNPNNPGHPPNWHTRHYGLFSANNFGARAFGDVYQEKQYKLKKGESFEFSYLILIKTGSHLNRREMEYEFTRFIQ